MIVPFLWISAFVFSLPLVEPYALARGLAVTCALGACVVAAGQALQRPEGLKMPRSGLLMVGGLFWALAAASIFWSAAPLESLAGFLTFSLLPLSALCFLMTPYRAKSLRIAAITAGSVIGALSLWVILQPFFFPDLLVGTQVRHPFANPNSFAALLALGVIPALALASEGGGLARWMARGLMFLIAMALVLIGGRAVPLMLAVGLLAFAVFTRGRGLRDVSSILALVIGVSVAMFLMRHLSPDGTLAIMRPLLEQEGVAAAGGRWPIWMATIDMIRDHLWGGTGIGTFHLYYPAYRLTADTESSGLMAHADPLQFWAEMGVAAVVLFYVFLLLSLWRMIRARPRRPLLAAGLFCTLGVLTAHSHVDFDFYVPSLLMLAGGLLAWWAMETQEGPLMPLRVMRLGEETALVVLAALMIAGLLCVQMTFISAHQVQKARAAIAVNDMDAFGLHVNAANELSLGMNAQAYVLAATLPIGMMHGSALAERTDLYKKAMNLLAEAEQRNRRIVAIPYYRAKATALYQPNGLPSVEDWLRAAIRLNPQHAESRLMLAERLQASGRKDEAFDILLSGVEWPYGTPDSQGYFEMLAAQALLRKDFEAYHRALRGLRRLESRMNAPAWIRPK